MGARPNVIIRSLTPGACEKAKPVSEEDGDDVRRRDKEDECDDDEGRGRTCGAPAFVEAGKFGAHPLGSFPSSEPALFLLVEEMHLLNDVMILGQVRPLQTIDVH